MCLESKDADFGRKVEQAVAALHAWDMEQARANIADAMALDMDAPQPHNLLGILYEMTGDFQAARKHYRAGYALDPTYKPCCRNLERISGFDSRAFQSKRDFGDEVETSEAPGAQASTIGTEGWDRRYVHNYSRMSQGGR